MFLFAVTNALLTFLVVTTLSFVSGFVFGFLSSKGFAFADRFMEWIGSRNGGMVSIMVATFISTLILFAIIH